MESKLKFNSKVCTTREQSKRLLELGLKPETADCMYFAMSKSYHGTDIPTGDRRYNLVLFFQDEIPLMSKEEYEYIPAWSLHRLIELLPQHIHLDDYVDTHYWLVINPLKVIYKNSYSLWIYLCDEGGLYDKLINTIEWTIKNNHFNKEYYGRSKHNNQRSEV